MFTQQQQVIIFEDEDEDEVGYEQEVHTPEQKFDFLSSEDEDEIQQSIKIERYRSTNQKLFRRDYMPYCLGGNGWTHDEQLYQSFDLKNYPTPGPKDDLGSLLNINKEWTVKDTVIYWTEDIYKHMMEVSNDYATEKKIYEHSHSSLLAQFTLSQMYTYWTVIDAMGLVQYQNSWAPWQEKSTYRGLLGNDWFKKTISGTRWHKLNRILHADMNTVIDMMNSRRRSLWTSYPHINFDDDMEGFKGYGGQKEKNDRKASGTGLRSYKAVDEKMFCLLHLWASDSRLKKPLGTNLWKRLNNALPPNIPYCLSADAGPLGAVYHADYLIHKGRKVLFSFTPNRDGWDGDLIDFIQSDLDMFDYHVLYHPHYAVASWYAGKTQSRKKVVNFVFNHNSYGDPTRVTRWSKTDSTYAEVPSLKAVEEYNHIKWFVDEKRSIISPLSFPFRHRRPFRA